LRHTIKRLFSQKGCTVNVVCIGDEADRATCEESGASFFAHPNEPLGAKWQYAFDMCRILDPDAVLYAGSSDWFCSGWVSTLLEEGDGFGVMGKTDINFIDLGPHRFRGVYWPKYAEGSRRENELMGAGRVLTRKCLDAMGWGVFDRRLNSSLDYSMCQSVELAGQKTFTSKNPALVSASISTHLWPNKHNFERTAMMPHCRVLSAEETNAIVGEHFQELYEAL
jgi:hypothetical protein